MNPNELSREEKKDSIIYGAILGLLSVVFSVISVYYSAKASNYSSLYVVSIIIKVLSSVLIPIGFVYLLKLRNGSNWTFSRALKSIYILLAVSVIVLSLGNIIANKFLIKSDTVELAYQNLMNLKIESMELEGISDDEIDKQLVIIEQQRDFALSPISFRTVVPPMFISLLINFIFAMVLAFLLRTDLKKKS